MQLEWMELPWGMMCAFWMMRVLMESVDAEGQDVSGELEFRPEIWG